MMKRVTADVYEETGGRQRPQQLSQMQREFYFASAPTSDPNPTTAPDPILSVYPLSVTVGEEVAMIADLPQSCTPFFYVVAPSGRFTPIPRKFYKTVALSNGQTRYEISPGSRYGLQISAEDEKGPNSIGYLCEPPVGTDQEILKAFLRQVRETAVAQSSEEGTLQEAGLTVSYQMRAIEIH